MRALAPDLVRTVEDGEAGNRAGDVADVLAFIDANDHFLLNVVMGAAKLVADAGAGVAGASVVVAMARNGTDFGVRVAGTGERWFTAPAAVPDGLYLGGFGRRSPRPWAWVGSPWRGRPPSCNWWGATWAMPWDGRS